MALTFDSDGCCVYAHSVEGKIVYVGSGTFHRAFSVSPSERNKQWHSIMKGRTFQVHIIDQCNDKGEAMLKEKKAIREFRPPANVVHNNRRGKIQKSNIKIVHGKNRGYCLGCRCDACRAAHTLSMRKYRAGKRLRSGK